MYTPMRNFLKVLFILIFLITALFVRNGLSQEIYPNKPITMVVAFGPGTIDTMTRTISKIAEKELGQPIIILNKIGAVSTIGVNYVLRSKPDGYTLGAVATTYFTLTSHMQKAPFNVLTDVTDIFPFFKYNQVLCVRADAPWNTYEDLIAYAKKNPGKFTYASPGTGYIQHITMERIAKKEGIKWVPISFKSSGESIAACIGAHTDGVALSFFETSAHIKAGKLKLLLVLTDSRLKEFPNVPTILEKGYDFDATSYVAVYGPAGIPESIRQRLEDVFKNATTDPSFTKILDQYQLGLPSFRTGKEYSIFWRSKYDDMGRVVKDLGLAAEQ